MLTPKASAPIMCEQDPSFVFGTRSEMDPIGPQVDKVVALEPAALP